MIVRKLKPTTPGQRHRIVLSYDTITTSTPEKSLIKKYKKTGYVEMNDDDRIDSDEGSLEGSV